uniref:(northern house mosquito) hypothetical protein n=1 Tax=Culex pipiens TaxID=7175 RepID=A0A8D8HKC5_CULPI
MFPLQVTLHVDPTNLDKVAGVADESKNMVVFELDVVVDCQRWLHARLFVEEFAAQLLRTGHDRTAGAPVAVLTRVRRQMVRPLVASQLLRGQAEVALEANLLLVVIAYGLQRSVGHEQIRPDYVGHLGRDSTHKHLVRLVVVHVVIDDRRPVERAKRTVARVVAVAMNRLLVVVHDGRLLGLLLALGWRCRDHLGHGQQGIFNLLLRTRSSLIVGYDLRRVLVLILSLRTSLLLNGVCPPSGVVILHVTLGHPIARVLNECTQLATSSRSSLSRRLCGLLLLCCLLRRCLLLLRSFILRRRFVRFRRANAFELFASGLFLSRGLATLGLLFILLLLLWLLLRFFI